MLIAFVGIAVWPQTVKAEFQCPDLKRVRSWLRRIGATKLKGRGKGDHEVWRMPDGSTIVLNAAKRNRKELDIACLKQLADKFGLSEFEMRNRINS